VPRLDLSARTKSAAIKRTAHTTRKFSEKVLPPRVFQQPNCFINRHREKKMSLQDKVNSTFSPKDMGKLRSP
jgi:hypothetical protein